MTNNVVISSKRDNDKGKTIYYWQKTAADNIECIVKATYTDHDFFLRVDDILIGQDRFFIFEDPILKTLADVVKDDIQEHRKNLAAQAVCRRAAMLDVVPKLLD